MANGNVSVKTHNLEKSTQNMFNKNKVQHTKMGIYRDNLSAIVICDNLLPIVVIAQNRFDLSITDTAFVKYFVIAD